MEQEKNIFIIVFFQYEGEFLNGKRNGKGKEYNKNGILIYEGEFLNGKINGKGKEYNHNKKLIFEGEFINGYKSKGKVYVKRKIEYEGEFKIKKNGMEMDIIKKVK